MVSIMIYEKAYSSPSILKYIIIRKPLIIQCRAEVRKIYGRIMSKHRGYTEVYQDILARICCEDFVLMQGSELLEVPIIKTSGNVLCAAGQIYLFKKSIFKSISHLFSAVEKVPVF